MNPRSAKPLLIRPLAAAHPAPEQDRLFKSQVLGELLGSVAPTDRLQVLDVGSGTNATVAFFGQFRCRLHIAELRSLADVSFPQGTQFDVVLFWDRLNQFAGAELHALAAAMRPHVHAGTHAHAFATGAAARPLPDVSYGIVDTQQIAVSAGLGGASRKPRTQNEITEAFDYLAVRRRTLLSSGRLELWLQGT